MEPTKRDARIAGLWYLSLLTAPFSLIYVPNKLIEPGDAAATAANIASHQSMFRLAIANELIGTVFFIFLLLALYRLLKSVDNMRATVMAMFGLMSVPISFAGAGAEIAALRMLHSPDLVMLLVRLHNDGMIANEIFWGLWLFPFGILIMRSGFIPRLLGALLIVNGIAYLIASGTTILFPAYAATVNPWMRIPETGELWIMLWLLVKGIEVRPLQMAHAPGAAA